MQVEDWQLLPERVAVHLPTATAVVADLHLGYREARLRGGEAVPKLELATILEPLQSAIHMAGVRRLLVAGDLFESAPSDDLLGQWKTWLDQQSIEFIALVPGNHDRGLAIEGSLPLAWDGFSLGHWHIIHGDRCSNQVNRVQGHDHPCLRWRGIVAPCFLATARHLILPAYSRDAAGVTVLGNPRWTRYRCGVIAGNQVLDFGLVGSLPHLLQRSRFARQ